MDKDKPRSSVSRTFNKALLIIYVIGVVAVVPIIYLFTRNELYDQANKELRTLVDVVSSVRAIVSEKTRPYFLAKGEFYSPVVSSTVMAKEFASQFERLQAAYLVRMISDNPLNPDNMPRDFEARVLETLRTGEHAKGLIEVGRIRGRNYLISAVPTKVRGDCLLCHGDPAAAPAAITAQYGNDKGFGWKNDEIVGATLVGVPIANLNDAVLKRSLIVIGIITALFAGALIVLNRVVQRTIIRPVLEITEAAKAISQGRGDEPLRSDRLDEIGSLTRAFELMRRSINIANDQILKLTRARKP